MVQKPAGAVFCRNAREESEIISLARPQWREYGKARAKAHAFDIRGFPSRRETMGSQDRRSAGGLYAAMTSRTIRIKDGRIEQPEQPEQASA